jgi:X-X-X-Leu-X-X-Gly heptad repeat protein
MEKLEGLKEQLAQVETFVQGVHDYTGGVDRAAAGAKELAAGAAQLQDEGTHKLRTEILGAEKQAALVLLPLLEGKLNAAVRVFEETGTQVKSSGYDLRPEGMKTVTAYIIRTDL